MLVPNGSGLGSRGRYGNDCIRGKWRIRPAVIISVFYSMERLGVFLFTGPYGIGHRRVTPSIKFAVTIYTPAWRDAL